MPPPIFILGVPRSGTTLLRTILDSHSAIAAGPETPWLGGHQPRSLMELWRFCREDPHGYAPSFGADPAIVTAAARAFADTLLSHYARSRSKRRWAEKTPDNALYLPFLLDLFPDAQLIHISRHPLDVALSTTVIADHRRGVSPSHERRLSFGPGCAVENNLFTALLRRSHWDRMIQLALADRPHHAMRYESLVAEPRHTLEHLVRFLGEPFEPAMLDYTRHPHHYPPWEWGSADVIARDGITTAPVGRWRRELTEPQQSILLPLIADGLPAPRPLAAPPAHPADPRLAQLADFIRGLAAPLALRTFAPESDWPALWLWLNALQDIPWRGRRLVHLRDPLSPIPWIAALLGARITLIAPDPDAVPLWTRLRDRLRVDAEWHIATGRIPLPDSWADVLTCLAGPPDPAEAARILKPGGTLASAGAPFPEHPAFASPPCASPAAIHLRR